MTGIVSTNKVAGKQAIPQVELSLASTGTHVYKHTHLHTLRGEGRGREGGKERNSSNFREKFMCY